jgi:hypothetical protein
MTKHTAARTPAFKAVWSEQVRSVGLAVRLEAAGALALLALTLLALVAIIWLPGLSVVVDGAPAGHRSLDPGDPPFGVFAVLAGLILPFLVWKGERPFGDTPLWALPVDHRRHALTKVAAGWVWLLAILSTALLCLALTGFAIGGSLGVEEVRLLILDPVGARDGVAGATRAVAWSTPWWEWVLPFTSATAAYLLVSSLIVGSAHPVRWAVVLWVMLGVAAGIADIGNLDGMNRGFDLMAWFIGADPFSQGVQLPDGTRGEGWILIPTVRLWLASATFWIGLGLGALLVASARRRDH